MGFDFIVIVPLLPSHCSFSFVFGCGVSFLVTSSVFLSMIVLQLVVVLVFSKEGVRFDISIHFKMVTRINLVVTCHHAKILHSYGLYSPCCAFHTHDSFILKLEVCTLKLPHLIGNCY